MVHLFYFIYVNQLCNLEIGGKIFSTADDTAVTFKEDTWEITYNRVKINQEILLQAV